MLQNKKHEEFCFVWHATGSKTEAYKKAFPSCLKWKDATVHNKAYALSKRGEILARYEELQQDALNSHGVTIKTLLNELEESRVVALSQDKPQAGAAVTATMGKAKLVGLDKQIIEQTTTVKPVKTFSDMYAD